MGILNSISKALSSLKNTSSSSKQSVTATKSSSSSGNGYNSGSNYSGRETAYTWNDGTTTYSNATRYQDAAKEAGKTGVGLSSAVTYSTGGPTVASGNGFTNKGYSNSSQTGSYYDQALEQEKRALAGINTNNMQYTEPLLSFQQEMYPYMQSYVPDYSAMFNNMQNQNNAYMQNITDMLNSYKNSGASNTILENSYVNDALGRKRGTGAYIKSGSNASNAISRYLAGDVFKNKR